MNMNNEINNAEDQSRADKILSSFMNNADSRNNLNKYFMLIIGLIFILFIWSNFTTIDQNVTIKGQIVPHSGIAKIKHEAGGEVIKIHVTNYQEVNKGDLLLTIDNNKILTGLKQNKSKLKVVDTEIAYAIAYLKNNIGELYDTNQYKEVTEYLNNIADTMEQSKQLVEASRLISDHKDKVIAEQINQNKIELQRLADEITVLEDELKYLDEQRGIFNQLLASKNVSKIRALDYEIRYREVLREFNNAKSNLEFKNKETRELESKRIVEKQDGIREKYEELVTLNKEKIDLVSTIRQLETSLQNLDITAPISGIVQGLDIVKGVTIRPGEEVLSIIPTDSPVVFEAKASSEQKGKISNDSPAEVQFDGFNILQYNRVPAKIINISPFTFSDKNPTQNEFIKVVVKLNQETVNSRANQYKIKPGMSGTLYITTEKQSLFAYLFGPIYSAFSNVYSQK